MMPPMSLREETELLQGLLEQHLSIEEGLHTPKDLPPYIDAMCNHVVGAGYEVPEHFELLPFIEGIEALLDSDKSLDESFLRKAVGAVKGAMARGLAKLPMSAHDKLRKYHGKKATNALDAGDEKAYVHHYQAKHFHQKHADPSAARQDAAHAKSYGLPKPGSANAARKNIWLSKQAAKTVNAQSKEPYADIKARKAAAKAASKPSDFVPQDEPLSRSSGSADTVLSRRPSEKTIPATGVTRKSR